MTKDFDRFIEHNNGPLVVVTVDVGGERDGCLVGFHAQASIEPPLYAVWLSRNNRTTSLAVKATQLALHYVEQSQRDVAAHWGSLTGDEVDKFATVAWDPGPQGLPLLTDCPNRLVLERVELLDVPEADHVCWLGRIASARIGAEADTPFRLADADGLSAGHEAGDEESDRVRST